LPLFNGKVAAGFPSPADDYVEKNLDLNELLVQKPAATFFVRAQGESMLGAGIHPNDILVVDRSLEAVPGKVVICAINGELTVKSSATHQPAPNSVVLFQLHLVCRHVLSGHVNARVICTDYGSVFDR
jgi:SOS-response transcriptional repressor LexA